MKKLFVLLFVAIATIGISHAQSNSIYVTGEGINGSLVQHSDLGGFGFILQNPEYMIQDGLFTLYTNDLGDIYCTVALSADRKSNYISGYSRDGKMRAFITFTKKTNGMIAYTVSVYPV